MKDLIMDRNRKWAPGFRVVLLIHMTLALEVPLDRKQFLLELFKIYQSVSYSLDI